MTKLNTTENVNNMITLKDIKGLSNIHDIPPEIHVNEGICLDPFLAYNLSDQPKTAVYDFNIWLEDYNIYLQRPFVWNQIQQQEFILSILLRKPIPPVVIVEMDSSASLAGTCLRKKLVIDGKQRLMTIKKFLHDEVSIPINDGYYTYSSFDQDAQSLFEREIHYLTATVYYASDLKTDKWYMSDYTKIVLFNFYNFAGTPQEKDHKDMLQNLLNK